MSPVLALASQIQTPRSPETRQKVASRHGQRVFLRRPARRPPPGPSGSGRHAALLERSAQSREVLEGDDYRPHPAVFRQNVLLGLAALQLVDHAVELTHRIADRAQLVVR